MITIGLIGGMSWESSLEYYRLVNEKTKEILGDLASCKCLMFSVDFSEIASLQHQGDWEKLGEIMIDAAVKLHKAGAGIIVLCTNTMHLLSESIKNAVPIPFLHIADATGMEISNLGLKKVGLLGTKFTMEKDFYKDILKTNHQVETIVPDKTDREKVHSIIYEELVLGKINSNSRDAFKTIINNLKYKGAEGIILGCTEIPLLISQHDVEIPIFNTTKIHAHKAVEWAIQKT